MRLLIVTQKVDKNDPILGFFHRWIEEFSKHCQSLVVICLEKGEYTLPENVKVLSLGKEEGKSKLEYVSRFYRYIWQERGNYDSVFVHMNQIYIILGGLLWRAWGKKVGLWYTHKKVSFSLRVAENITDKIFTASKESFRLPSNKLHIMGHGIDTELFKPKKDTNNKNPYILTVGRISKVKNIDLMIDAIKLIKKENVQIRLMVVGEPIYQEDRRYLENLKEKIRAYDLESEVSLVGSVEHSKLPSLYQNARVFINLSDTGSLDKAILEAMSSNVYVITSNEAFRKSTDTFLPNCGADQLASAIKLVFKSGDEGTRRGYVVSEHNMESLISKIITEYEQVM